MNVKELKEYLKDFNDTDAVTIDIGDFITKVDSLYSEKSAPELGVVLVCGEEI